VVVLNVGHFAFAVDAVLFQETNEHNGHPGRASGGRR
jgi:hypothetical protein